MSFSDDLGGGGGPPEPIRLLRDVSLASAADQEDAVALDEEERAPGPRDDAAEENGEPATFVAASAAAVGDGPPPEGGDSGDGDDDDDEAEDRSRRAVNGGSGYDDELSDLPLQMDLVCREVGELPPQPASLRAWERTRSTTRSTGSRAAAGRGEVAQRRQTQPPPARERPSDNVWPARESLSFTRSLVFYGSGAVTREHETACRHIMESRSLRSKYFGGGSTVVSSERLDEACSDLGKDENCDDLVYRFGPDGVVELYRASDALEMFRSSSDDAQRMAGKSSLISVPDVDDFVKDYTRLVDMCRSGAMRSFSFQRLQMLTSAFKMHVTANGHAENEAQSNLLGTDFYRTMKVDNHIHLAAAASAKQFVNFVRDKLQTEGDTVVLEDGKTLREVFDDAGLDSDHLTIDAFNVLADYSVYQRFDNFNSKYSPFRLAQMRKIFLKVENKLEGRYFAELTKIVLARHEQSKGHNSAAEMRLSVYGMEREEWLNLARWILRDWEGGDFPGPVLSTHNRWVVQVPRLWRIYCLKGKGKGGGAGKGGGGGGQQGQGGGGGGGPPPPPSQRIRTFQEMLENLFRPMFEATLYPERNPEVSELLRHVVALDSVDDEGIAEAPCSCARPSSYTDERNPAYCWQLYYLWANLEVLNRLREARGLNAISFRPHAGETGDVMHLAASYMLCRSINHGINLHRQVSLQYLYYLDQVGLSISPLSNNFLFCKISNNPFPKFFRRGMNVTLSTDDPLLFHMSDDALLEEYSVARATFDLSMTDISEIARNSVLQSDFEPAFKREWLGENYGRGVTHCDENRTHVPLIRAKFRAEHLGLEHMLVTLISAGKGGEVLRDMMAAFSTAREAHRQILVQNFGGDGEIPSFPGLEQI